MSFVVTQYCHGCKYTDCVAVCPCECDDCHIRDPGPHHAFCGAGRPWPGFPRAWRLSCVGPVRLFRSLRPPHMDAADRQAHEPPKP
jgi:hypothetical protein